MCYTYNCDQTIVFPIPLITFSKVMLITDKNLQYMIRLKGRTIAQITYYSKSAQWRRPEAERPDRPTEGGKKI